MIIPGLVCHLEISLDLVEFGQGFSVRGLSRFKNQDLEKWLALRWHMFILKREFLP